MTNYSMANRTYRYFDGEPRFSFGYGLSYSLYNYHDLVLSPTRVKAGNNVTASFAITNQGPYGGREVLHDMNVSLDVRPCPTKISLHIHKRRLAACMFRFK